jgi:uncharacterized membrane protein SpoIIM required for sporulation
MKQERFVALYAKEWDSLQAWLVVLDRQPRRGMRSEQALDFPAAYRRICHHLALARGRGYSHEVTERLQYLVQRGHRVLYQPPSPRWHRAAAFLVVDFPRLVRSQWRCMALAALLFYVPALVLLVWVQMRPELAHTLFSSAQLAEFEHMYDPSNHHLGRSGGTNLMMFGYYIYNNVGIAFRTFASGLLFGVGAIYVLGANGIIVGGVAGHLMAIGYGGPFWRFVITHSAFELTALIIAGGAGLQLGLTLLMPGRRRRGPALVEAGWIGAKLVLGAFAMLVAAACIEAYWSSQAALPDALRFSVAVLAWLLVLGWLGFGGRARRHGA